MKRLAEIFVDNNYGETHEVIKTYDKNVLVAIEIMPQDEGRSVLIWDKNYFEAKPEDNDFTIELEMHLLEQKLMEDEEEIKESINYFLADEDLLCICMDYGDYIDVEVIYDDETNEDVMENHIKPILLEIGAIKNINEESDVLAEVVSEALLKRNEITICGVTLFISEVSYAEFMEMEDC